VAGRLVRFASLLYEGFLLVPILFLGAYLFLALAQQDAHSGTGRLLFRAWLLAVVGVYFVTCWVKGGGTLAMKAWQLKLARIDGGPVGARQAWLRYALAVPGLFLFGSGYLWAFVDRDRQFLHDRLAGTRIYRLATSHHEDTKARRRAEKTTHQPAGKRLG
jgi:uncharacterized RDD family membrane protein YckC